jgi:ABC-type nitrate/sulfonate/bicarbonate transport system substrate-binding protein
MFNRGALAGLGGAVLAGATGGLVREAHAEDTINFQTVWLNDPEFLGYMIGIDNGYYAAEGLKVNYIPGGPDVIPEGSLLAGKADIALTAPLSTIQAIAEKGAPFKIIGTQFQKAPDSIITLASSNINSPKDLVGKQVACPPLSQPTFKAMLAANGINENQVRIVPYTFDPTPLATGAVDAVVDFMTETPFLVEQASGKKAAYFLMWDFGLPLYVDTIVVTEDTLKSKRAQIVKFLRASRKGWAENEKDLEKYPKLYQDTWFKGNGSTLEAEIYHNKAQIPLMDSPKGLFFMDADGIQRNLDALAKVGVKGKADMFDTSILSEI